MHELIEQSAEELFSVNAGVKHELANNEPLPAVKSATRLAHNARNDDTVSRYGGDESLCLLTPLHEQKDISMIAAKMYGAKEDKSGFAFAQ